VSLKNITKQGEGFAIDIIIFKALIFYHMAFTRENLKKFIKSTGLVIDVIEDDSSADTEVKILLLAEPVNAVGSNPTPEGKEMRVTGRKVYVAAEDVDKMLDGLTEQDGKLVYNGPMHLDVSKPKIRTVNGQPQVTAAAKIWLTATKFSRRGVALQQQRTNDLTTMLNSFFGSGVVDLAAESIATPVAGNEEEKGDDKKTGALKPEVVANKK